MPRLIRNLAGAEPVDEHGIAIGPPVTLPAEAEFVVTIRKLKRPSDSFEELWCEIGVGNQLYRVPLRLLETANAA
jgi:hypothetical protein